MPSAIPGGGAMRERRAGPSSWSNSPWYRAASAVWLALLGLTVWLLIRLGHLDPSPHGLMGLELANGEHLARLMVSEWKRAGEIGNALRSLDLDRWYFIPTYTIVVLALGLWGRGALRPGSKIKPAIPQAQVPRPTSQRLATYIALLILVTAVSDYVEDWGLRKIL